jgi:hypothetical protein
MPAFTEPLTGSSSEPCHSGTAESSHSATQAAHYTKLEDIYGSPGDRAGALCVI